MNLFSDFLASIRTGAQPAMRLERAGDDQRLMDQIIASAPDVTIPVEAR